MGARGTEVEETEAVAACDTPQGVFVKVPRHLHRQLKAEAAMSGRQLSEFAQDLLEYALSNYPGLKLVNGGHGKD